jgi:hypothetical protein
MKLIPKNWESFQHYKDRSPTWIKLHKHLLDDMAFQRLPVGSRALAPMLWLLASESVQGIFNGSTEELSFRLRQNEKEISVSLDALIKGGFFILYQDASSPLADCYATLNVVAQLGSPEKRREETEKDTDLPEGVSPSTWQDFKKHRKAKKSPITDTAIDGISREAEKAGWTLENALSEICSRGWTGFKAEWVANDKPASQMNNSVLAGAI